MISKMSERNTRRITRKKSSVLAIGFLLFIICNMKASALRNRTTEFSPMTHKFTESDALTFSPNSEFFRTNSKNCSPNCTPVQKKNNLKNNSDLLPQRNPRTHAGKLAQTEIKCKGQTCFEKHGRTGESESRFHHTTMYHRGINPMRKQMSSDTSKNMVHFPSKGGVKYSKKYNPEGRSSDSGFLPIPNPFRSQRKLEERSPLKQQNVQEDIVHMAIKQNYDSDDVLGNGNFEVLGGGVFSEGDSNEIGGGRRMGRGFGPFVVVTKRPANPPEKVHFPDYFKSFFHIAPPIYLRRAEERDDSGD